MTCGEKRPLSWAPRRSAAWAALRGAKAAGEVKEGAIALEEMESGRWSGRPVLELRVLSGPIR